MEVVTGLFVGFMCFTADSKVEIACVIDEGPIYGSALECTHKVEERMKELFFSEQYRLLRERNEIVVERIGCVPWEAPEPVGRDWRKGA